MQRRQNAFARRVRRSRETRFRRLTLRDYERNFSAVCGITLTVDAVPAHDDEKLSLSLRRTHMTMRTKKSFTAIALLAALALVGLALIHNSNSVHAAQNTPSAMAAQSAAHETTMNRS